MIRVTIELVPFGREEEKETLHTIEIENTGWIERSTYGYDVLLNKEKIGELKHNRDKCVLSLLKKVFTIKYDWTSEWKK